ncbi:unnamed protein product [Chondrus crispus]|uniref:Uncharacterized protein n=1 Tax=Chondrus crispus TaxID=2769 RepID=R7QRH1_CHOCR|nr:unnamed protein product [Chondrus crispus]CDF40348.1 unnamed protein product [Chondrus crispus]|eukprot:XP_005710642.1 unnamed protein product [Chondrus crispus]
MYVPGGEEYCVLLGVILMRALSMSSAVSQSRNLGDIGISGNTRSSSDTLPG